MYYIDFTGFTEEQVVKFLKDNSQPKCNEQSWIAKPFVEAMFSSYPDNPAVIFSSKDSEMYTGFASMDWINKGDYQKINIQSLTTIQEFYSGKSITLKNGEILSIQQVLLKDDDWWDGCHDFIQWVFPTVTVSQHSVNAPILTKDDADYIRNNHLFLFNAALERFYTFLQSVDMTVFNHNHLRITRMIESVNLIMNDIETGRNLVEFFDLCVENLPGKTVRSVTTKEELVMYDFNTFNYWVKAMNSKFA